MKTSEDDSGDEEEQQQSDEEEEQSEEEDSKADAAEDDMDDLLGLSFGDDSPTTTTTTTESDGLDDIFGMSSSPPAQQQVELHSLASGKGLDLQGAIVCKNNGDLVFRMKFSNGGNGKFVIQFNKNPFGYQHQKGSFQPDASGMYDMPIGKSGQKVDKFTSGGIQAAMKAKNGQFEGTKYFYIPWELAAISNKSSGPVEKSK